MNRLLAAALIAAAIVGPIWATGQEEKAKGPVDLVFRQSDPAAEVVGLVKAIDDWNASQSRIKVKVETVPWSDALNQYVREAQAGSTKPDVLQVAFVWTKDLATTGLITKLDDLIKKDAPGKGIDDFLGTDLGVYKDGIYGIPWTVDTNVMAYRPDLFRKAGIDAFPDDWDAFFAAAKKLTVDTNGDGKIDQYGFGFPAGSAPGGTMWFLVNYYIWSNGKTMVEPDGAGGWRMGVKVEDLVECMKYFNRFIVEGITPKSLIGVSVAGDPEITGGLARGEFAMGFFTPSVFRVTAKQSQVPLASAKIPKGRVMRISHLGGRALVLNTKTKNPDESWAFLKALTGKKIFESYNQFPAQKSLLKDIVYPEPEKGFAEQLPFAVTFKRYIESPVPVNTMWETVNREFGAYYSGQKTPEQAAADIIKVVQPLVTKK
jgi:multiple sugar transport system substrate-binding protein